MPFHCRHIVVAIATTKLNQLGGMYIQYQDEGISILIDVEPMTHIKRILSTICRALAWSTK